ncbi:MAG: hypothetical protein Q8P17_00820 [bacterium]|nr:hypothetical protein [bacterium]
MKDEELTADLIRRRIENFWGYGNLEAPVWFVGMEEGLNPTTDVAELEMRFRVADGKATVDMRHDMSALANHMRWFRPGARIQPTWKYPIALHLYLKNGKIPDKEEIRDHQARVLGDSVLKESTTIELMPLPSQKAHESTWLYAKYNVQGLSSREEYISTFMEARVRKLKDMLVRYKPKLVIFYSVSYLPKWSEIIGVHLGKVTSQMYFAKNGGTSFCIIPQGHGMSYKRLYEYASLILKKS